MAVSNGQQTLTTTPALIYQGDADGSSILVENTNPTAAACYLGGDATVTSSSGKRILAGGQIGIDLDPSEAVYGVTGSGTCTVDWLANR